MIMIPHFIGLYDTIPIASDSDTYKFQRDFGFIRDDGIMVISQKDTTTDGASIPKFMWWMFGSPLQGANKEWSAPHDSLYRKQAIIIDCVDLDPLDITTVFENWRDLASTYFIHQASLDKWFADDTLRQAMIASGSSEAKRWAVYHAVRMFGKGWWQREGRR